MPHARRFWQLVIAGTVAAVVLGALVAPAGAETVTKRDPHPRCSQAAPLDLERASFTYSQQAFKVRLKMAALSKKRTQVFARYTVGTSRGDKYGVQLASSFSDGRKRAVGYWSDYRSGEYGKRFTRGLDATWDWQRRTVTFVLTEHLRGRRVMASAYSVAKGAMHGPPCGDYIVVRNLRRG